MHKKNLLWMAMFILTIGGSMTLASCHDDDNLPQAPSTTDNSEEAFRQKLINSTNIDLSEAIASLDGTENEDEIELTKMSIWLLKDDGTFEYHWIDGMGEDGANANSAEGLMPGQWEVFTDMENPWTKDGEKLSGFRAAFAASEDGSNGSYSGEVIIKNYYAIELDNGVMLILSDGCMDYLAMMSQGIQSRGWWSNIWNSVGKVVNFVRNEVVDFIHRTPEEHLTWFHNFFGLDAVSSFLLSQAESSQYQAVAESRLKELQNGHNTNYAEWMGEIYTKNNKNPRICEMNIPGSHDTFTHYMEEGILGTAKRDWACTQTCNIAGQWNAGIRSFDARIKMDNNEMIMSHTFSCNITVKKGLQEICDQLKAHPTEAAIVFFQFDGDNTEQARKAMKEIVESDEIKPYIAQNLKPGITLNECAGKMICIQSWDSDNKEPSTRLGASLGSGDNTYITNGYINFFDTGEKVGTTCYYQNRYAGSVYQRYYDFCKIKRGLMTKCFEDTQKTKGSADNIWVMNQGSAYVGGAGPHMSYAKHANSANPWIFYYITNDEGKHKSDKMGIVTMDYAGSDGMFDFYNTNGKVLPKAIAETNRYQ